MLDRIAPDVKEQHAGALELKAFPQLRSIITIDDVSTMDASTYVAWVNQQAESLPNIFVAQRPTATTDEPPATNISISAIDTNNNKFYFLQILKKAG
jgi:hypothetical protein